MNIVVLNGSPAGKNSITLYTLLFIRKHFPEHQFEILHVGQQIKRFEKDFSPCAEKLKAADLILFCYPVYTFLVPSQLHRFIELMKEHHVDVAGKFAAQVTTSLHFYDITAHRFVQDNCGDLGLKYIKGLSADMEDLLKEKGQKEALDFFRFVLWSMESGCYENRTGFGNGFQKAADARQDRCFTGREAHSEIPCELQDELQSEAGSEAHSKAPGELQGDAQNNLQGKVQSKVPGELQDGQAGTSGNGSRVVIVADLSNDSDGTLQSMIDEFKYSCKARVSVADIGNFPFAGGCLGCFHCAADGTCVYKDGFENYLREFIQTADAIVYAFTIKDHSMGYRFKLYDDRQFCNGHRTVTMGKPVGYLIDGDYDRETNLQTLIESRAQVGSNFLAGVAVNCGQWNTDLQSENRQSTDWKSADQRSAGQQIKKLALTLDYAIRNSYQPPENFYGVGGMKIFRDLIYQMRGLMKADHAFYKKHGIYDFPQKRKGRIVAMYLVGAMMRNRTLQKKINGKMTEGMIMPYKKVIG